MKKLVVLSAALLLLASNTAFGAYRFSDFKAHPPIHILGTPDHVPKGLTPSEIKAAYHLPKAGGHGTIAIVSAFDDPKVETDLGVFSVRFGIKSCTTANGCFKKHKMSPSVRSNSGWALEASLDTQWAHAIAPDAKILLVEAKTPSGANLLKALDYARSRRGVVAISMSWGGPEFSDETSLDKHFTSTHIAFFASSGDNGTGASWPAASPNVIAVGGTTLILTGSGSVSSEKAWNGSGGGVSAYESQPDYQKSYSIPRAKGMRAIPDVSYNADPASGYPVYKTSGKTGKWYTVGGTSAGAPQWAAIQSLGLSAALRAFYSDKSSEQNGIFFRDIVSGSNGGCFYYCNARKHYDYVTGLGSPLTVDF